MREFFRVLKQNGWAILLVPIRDGVTYEDSSIVDPEGRLEAFGQEDHVRIYGTDLVYLNRLKEAGFNVVINLTHNWYVDKNLVNLKSTYFCYIFDQCNNRKKEK